jgi:uncharacterized protein (DUF2062 family)
MGRRTLSLRGVREEDWANAWKQYFREWFLESTQSNLRLSLTVALGVFIGILPIFGLQSITALSLAWVFRFNKLITLAGSGISTPPLTPLVSYPGYVIGGWFVETPHVSGFSEITLEVVKSHFVQYAIGSCIFASMAALIAGLLLYFTLNIVRTKRSAS